MGSATVGFCTSAVSIEQCELKPPLLQTPFADHEDFLKCIVPRLVRGHVG